VCAQQMNIRANELRKIDKETEFIKCIYTYLTAICLSTFSNFSNSHLVRFSNLVLETGKKLNDTALALAQCFSTARPRPGTGPRSGRG
jgi:hypothetical protein